jgi:chorismate mutase/prephenate dehydratase
MNLQEIRAKIDAIDTKLLRLLNERTRLSERVGAIKKKSGQPVFAPEREETLLAGLEKSNPGPLPNQALRAIYREILSASRQHQKRLKLLYLGPEASYCHEAALKRFGTSDEFVACRTIPEIFATLNREEADAGIIPIENSIEGGVNAAHDAIVDTELLICGEIYLRINHVLMSRETSLKKIRTVYSHPQALGQCRQWLAQNLPEADLVEVSSTSLGARKAKESKETAAVASIFAARHTGLKVLKTKIQDRPRNLTRFLIFSRIEPKPTKNDKTSLLFAISHEVGALSKVLNAFAKHRLNLEKIESRPAVGRPWEYLFFVDVKGHFLHNTVKSAVEEVRPYTLWLKVLGSYPEASSNV